MLWVKGSGGDLASMKLDGFATLYLERLEALRAVYREEHDDDGGYFPHCTFNLNPRATSIDTPPHCSSIQTVDHMHADAVIAIAAARDGEQLTREIWQGNGLGRLAAPRVRSRSESWRVGPRQSRAQGRRPGGTWLLLVG